MNGEMRSGQEVEEGDGKLFCKHLCAGGDGGGRGWMDGWTDGEDVGASFNDKHEQQQQQRREDQKKRNYVTQVLQ